MTFIYPATGGVALVQAPSGATSGTICARGDDACQGATLANYIYGKVYPGVVTNPPLNPPPGCPYVLPTGTTGEWEFPALSGAACNAAGTAANTLVLWLDFGGSGYSLATNPFYGQQSAYTDCTASGSGSGSALSQLALRQRTAPRQWKVVAEGFDGRLAVFNGEWLLTSATESMASVWVNAGDGINQPRVELRRDDQALRWLLTFSWQTTMIEYAHPIDLWTPLNSNIFRGPVVRPAEKVPTRVVVLPV